MFGKRNSLRSSRLGIEKHCRAFMVIPESEDNFPDMENNKTGIIRFRKSHI